MQLESRSILFLVIALTLLMASAWGCSEVSDAPANFSEERLRARIAFARSQFSSGDFEAYVKMWSARMRPSFRESEEDWQKNLRSWRLFLDREKPTFELLDVQITGLRARAKMRVSVLDTDGSRAYGTTYDYWVFENDDWFLDDAGRSE